MIEVIQGDCPFPTWRYTLIAPDGQIELKHLPDGWQDNGIEWFRDDRDGLGREYILQLRFVKEGADFLREQIRKYGISREVIFKIEEYKQADYSWHLYHETVTVFSDCKDVDTGTLSYFEVQFIDRGIKESVAINSKNNYEIELNKEIYITEVANVLEFVEYNAKKTGVPGNVTDSKYPLLTIKESEIVSPGIAFLNVVENYQPFLKKLVPDSLNIKFTGKLVVDLEITTGWTNAPTIEKTCEVHINNNAGKEPFFISNTVTLNKTGEDNGWSYYKKENIEIDIDFTYNFNTIDDWHYYLTLSELITSDGFLFIIKECTLQTRFLGLQIAQPYKIKAISLFDLGRALIAKAHSEPFTFTSELMKSGAARDIYVTSGDAIRGSDNAVIKTNLNDYYASVNAAFFTAAFSNEQNTYSIESKELAYNKDLEVFDLGTVHDIEVRGIAQYTAVLAGSADKEYNAVNGRYEFNTEYEFSVKQRVGSNTLDLRPKYRTDSFGVHHARYQANKSKSGDTKADNDVFFIHATMQSFDFEGAQITALTPYTQHEIVGDDIQNQRAGIFNVYLSPKRCMLRWERYLAAILHQTDGILHYETVAKSDAYLVSKLLGDYEEIRVVTEREDMIVNLKNPLYYPQTITLYTHVPGNIAQIMKGKETGYFKFTYKNRVYKGFVKQAEEYNPPGEPMQNCTLYMHPQTPWDYKGGGVLDFLFKEI